jgi:hypothetical protein
MSLRSILDSDTASRHWPLLALPITKLVLHLLTFRGYGIFRDELYYIMCGQRLDWGYVDHPPLSLLVLRVVQEMLGESLFVLRLVPALAGAAAVLLVGLMTRALGGGRYAQIVAMTAAVLAPIYLGLNHFYSMNALSILFWAVAGYLVVRIGKHDHPRLWIILGIVLGLGLLNKLSVLWLGFGLAVGIILTPLRRKLLTPWPWVAAGLALLLLSPHLIWQVAHDWPTVEFIRNATGLKMARVTPLDFLASQADMMNPVLSPIWLGGLVWLLAGKAGPERRALAWIYLAVLGLLLAMGSSRPGYLAPAYTWLLAAGGVATEALAERLTLPRLRWLVVAIVVLAGVALAPFALPVLPVPDYIDYARRMGVMPSTSERKELAELPQFYADMHGWQELADTIDGVYQQLSPADQQRACVYAGNYGEAGAIEVLGGEQGQPPVVSGHNNYWLWGPGGNSGEVMIIIGGERERIEELFASAEQVATVECGYCMPYENHQPVWVARDLKMPIAELWPQLKHFD